MVFSLSFINKLRSACLACLMGMAVVALVSCQKKVDLPTPVQLPPFISQTDSIYSLKLGNVEMKVDAAVAARVKSFQIDGQEILVTPKEIDSGMWGNAFWTSPQREWEWPPLVALDSAPYSAQVEADGVVFTSKVEERTGYQFIKKFGIDAKKNAFFIRYWIINHSREEKHLAAWEVTRLKPRGHIFFPTGDGEPFSGIFYPLDVKSQDGISWFDYDLTKIKNNHHKFMSDGKEGWMAYTDKRFVLVKEFNDIPAAQMVPGEAEVGIFASGKKDYLEIAEQGASTVLEPGEQLEWDIYWHLEKLPEGVDNTQSNPELIQFVRHMLGH